MSHNVVVLNEVLFNMGKADSEYPDQDSFNTVVGLLAHYLCGQLNVHPSEHPDAYKEIESFSEIVLSTGASFVSTHEKLGGDGMCPRCEEYGNGCDPASAYGVSDVMIYKRFVDSYSEFITSLRNHF